MKRLLISCGMLVLAACSISVAQGNDAAVSQPATIAKMTIAATNMEQMVNFYQNAFDTEMQSFEAMGETFYSGLLFGMNVVFCPNKLAEVNAEQNRQQFDVLVADIDTVLETAKENGGSVKEQPQVSGNLKYASVLDPDGNSIVLLQKVTQN